MEFIEAPAFTQYLSAYLKEEGFRELQSFIMSQPEAGDVIQGTGGFRKIRWSDPRRGKGKRGGLRVIYYYFSGDEQIWLLTIYDKGQSDDLSPDQRRVLKELIDAEKKARAKGKEFLGESVLQYLVSPALQGIYGVPAEELSVRALFGEFEVLPGETLVSAARRWGKARRGSGWRREEAANPGHPRAKTKVRMMAPALGMQALVDALVDRVKARLGERVVLNHRAEKLPRGGNVILAVPAYVAAELLEGEDPRVAEALRRVSYVPLSSVTLFLNKTKLGRIPRGVGVLSPQCEKRAFLGILFNSSAFEGRVKDEKWVSCTVIGDGRVARDMAQVEGEFRDLFGLERDGIVGYETFHWPRALPKYDENLARAWEIAREGWGRQDGNVLFGNYTGKISVRGMMEVMRGFR